MSQSSPKRTSLLTLGSAAVIAVYAAGFSRTRSAAAAFANEGESRRPAHVSPSISGPISKSISGPTFQPRTAAEVTDSIAVAAITAGINAPRKTANAAKLPGTKKPARRVAAAKRKTTSAAASIPTTPVEPARPTPSVPEPAPVATAPTPAPEPEKPAQPPRGQYRDGVYKGYGTSRHGDIEAEVEIRDGRIASARISQCLTRYSCSWISQLPAQVVARQSADVDYVSGATQSSDAFYLAVTEALGKAK